MDPINQVKDAIFAIKDFAGIETFNRDIHSVPNWRKHLEAAYAEIDWKSQSTPAASLQQAAALRKLGRRNEAIHLLQPEKGKEQTAVFLARLQIENGAPEGAIGILVDLLKKKARSNHVKLVLLEAMRSAGDQEGWSKKIRQWEGELKNRPEFLYQKARCHEENGEYKEAAAGYSEALGVDPDNRESLFRLALLECRLGRPERAVQHYERLRSLRPTYVNALVNLAVLYEDNAEYEMAQRILREVLSEYPRHPRASLFLKDVSASKDMFYDEDLERKNDKRLQVLRTPVTDFELSVRSRNCLKQMDIDTLGDLVTKTEQELLSHKNFGETSLAEIKSMLAQRNLRLGMVKKGDEIPGFTDARSSRNREILSRPITELELSVRSRKCMERMNVNTIGELCEMSDQDLLAVRNFGQTSLVEIRTKLGELGLKLKGDP